MSHPQTPMPEAGHGGEAAVDFDPLVPSAPISYPIKTLEDLASRTYFDSFHYPFNVSSAPLSSSSERLPDRARVLVCHDMQGGYKDDRWVQGGDNPAAFGIWHWYLIDIFVYFSHDLVTLPPPCWSNTAHRHGVRVLGTFIIEWDEGIPICRKLLATQDSSRLYAERLSELAVSLGFDGWLLNIEVKLGKELVPNLLEFISHLTEKMHSSVPGSLVIWYDSVTVDGDLTYQNQLNESNKPFFEKCDGIFTNYNWKENYPKMSAAVAGDRKYDVYMGIDVFGRNTYGGGEWKTNVALDVLKEGSVSAAIYAPGWVYEKDQPPDFETAQNRWWGLVEDSWGAVQSYPKALPFYSNFDQGRGYHFSVHGNQISSDPWNNISRQGLQPFVKFGQSDTIDVLVNFKGESYSGGGNITFRGTLSSSAYVTTRLFNAGLQLGSSPIRFSYSVKLGGSSKIGLHLEFSSPENELNTILLAPSSTASNTLSRLLGKFPKVAISHRSSDLEPAPESGWIIEENSIAVDGSTLTGIHAVCYHDKPDDDELVQTESEFYAVMGHILIDTPEHHSNFLPASSWVVEGYHVKWGSANSLSVKIVWKLKEGEASLPYHKYNVYVEKMANESEPDSLVGRLRDGLEFIGTAHVAAFYVSELAVPTGISTVRFIIQAWGDDGASQELGDSPFLVLKVPIQ
ncbi:hypothetical protein SAY87_001174 [Trapa incisa]|uniref:mannosyl-glycoprotein endo-beta-N-acetylglucosaminidase n=1 Tax=Trapa incisa TaxID=236973 RepID=A0AAN7GFR9_9MYRT|nr:hypothetical protein SAY87_001174 [Trapa incisa]